MGVLLRIYILCKDAFNLIRLEINSPRSERCGIFGGQEGINRMICLNKLSGKLETVNRAYIECMDIERSFYLLLLVVVAII